MKNGRPRYDVTEREIRAEQIRNDRVRLAVQYDAGQYEEALATIDRLRSFVLAEAIVDGELSGEADEAEFL